MVDHHGEHGTSAQEIQTEIASAMLDVCLRGEGRAEFLE
jgi:hypothetical protein